MVIKSLELETVCGITSKFPENDKLEMAFWGRSNVGKSSLINTLMNRKSFARISSQPGKTQTVNYYNVNDIFYLVDLPGYGYAKVNKQEKQKWGGLIENYLRTSKRLVNVFVLVDMRHEPTDDDKMLINYLYNYNIPFTIIATKADKLSRAQQQKCLATIASALCVGTKDILVTSASTKTGKEGVLARIDMLLENARSVENTYSDENENSNENAGFAENNR